MIPEATRHGFKKPDAPFSAETVLIDSLCCSNTQLFRVQMPLRTYHGDDKLVFSIDLGTAVCASAVFRPCSCRSETYGCGAAVVAFAHLEDGEEPRIRVVTRWPGQEGSAGA